VELNIEKGPEGAVADAVVMTADTNGEAPADDVLAYLMMAHGLNEDSATDWIASARKAGEIRFRRIQVPQYLGVFSGQMKRDVEDTDQGETWDVQGEVVGEVHRYVWDFMLSVPHRPVPVGFIERDADEASA
jgi:hypothetical protein